MQLPASCIALMDFRHLSREEKQHSLDLYEEAFPEDKGAYAAYYYKWKCRDNEILALVDSDRITDTDKQDNCCVPGDPYKDQEQAAICAMLHLNPYRIWVSTDSMILHYIVAVATAMPYRRQGCMRRLMLEAFSWLYNQKEPFTYLMPADTAYYEPFGFRVIYDQKPVIFPADPDVANTWARKHFDVVTLRDEAYLHFLDAEPDQGGEADQNTDNLLNMESSGKIVSGAGTDTDSNGWKPQIMCRIIYLPRLLECLRANQPKIVFLQIFDPLIEANNGLYRWSIDREHSHVTRLDHITDDICSTDQAELNWLTIGIDDLAEQLFGVKPLNPSLSHIRTLNRICINEEV